MTLHRSVLYGSAEGPPLAARGGAAAAVFSSADDEGGAPLRRSGGSPSVRFSVEEEPAAAAPLPPDAATSGDVERRTAAQTIVDDVLAAIAQTVQNYSLEDEACARFVLFGVALAAAGRESAAARVLCLGEDHIRRSHQKIEHIRRSEDRLSGSHPPPRLRLAHHHTTP